MTENKLLTIWSEKMKRSLFVILLSYLVSFFFINFLFSDNNFYLIFSEENSKIKNVLILYSSGKPTNQVKIEVPNLDKNIDIITSPTSKYNNTEVVALMIAESFKKNDFDTILKNIDDIKTANDILFADIIIIGSPTHYGFMDWKTKRFFDETLYPIYIHREMKLKDKYIGCFTTTKGGGGERCIRSIQDILNDFGSKKLPGLVVYSKESSNNIQKKVNKFLNDIIISLKKK